MRKSLLFLACTALLLTACPEDRTADGTPAASGQAKTSNADQQRSRAFASAADTGSDVTAQLVAGAPRGLASANAGMSAAGRQTGGTQPTLGSVLPFVATEIARFNEPWAMTFLHDGRLLVTEKSGQLKLLDVDSGQVGEITGEPTVAYGGQGGLGDVVLDPYSAKPIVYLSYAEPGQGSTRGAAVARGRLTLDANGGGSLSTLQVIWRQVPKVNGSGHYSHRIAFDGRGKLWISSGDRQQFTPAQDMLSNLGKILRLNRDGTIPADNPFVDQGGVTAEIWSLGHRNALGLAFDAQGRLWEHEMGPLGGDELNLIERGSNYGWPIVSNGDHYDGTDIPDHDTRPDLNAPEAWWTPVIAPSGFIIYSGVMFPQFRGNGFIGGLASQALIRIAFNGVQGAEAARYAMGQRIREVEQGPDGAIWVLEDGANARLLKLTPN